MIDEDRSARTGGDPSDDATRIVSRDQEPTVLRRGAAPAGRAPEALPAPQTPVTAARQGAGARAARDPRGEVDHRRYGVRSDALTAPVTRAPSPLAAAVTTTPRRTRRPVAAVLIVVAVGLVLVAAAVLLVLLVAA